jgi:uncharacterized repeat protein (TIGR04138 family)
MRETAFMEAVKQIFDNDSRYDMEAYIFMREALDYTIKMLEKPDAGPSRHLSGQELLEGLRQYALSEFGPMSLKVLASWGISSSDDFGAIVFNLVNAGEFGKTDDDKAEDFSGGYDFHDAFAKPFLPKGTSDSDTPPPAKAPKRKHL